MSMDGAYIWHVTTSTGHVRKSYRAEVAESVIQQVSSWLDSDAFDLPGGYRSIVMYRTAQALEVHVRSPADTHLVTIGIVLDDRRAGAAMWRRLDGAGDQPDQPWCAARLEEGIASDMSATHWLGDFERCLAWGFYDRQTATDTAPKA